MSRGLGARTKVRDSSNSRERTAKQINQRDVGASRASNSNQLANQKIQKLSQSVVAPSSQDNHQLDGSSLTSSALDKVQTSSAGKQNNQAKIVHEAIIDLYLQVKIRSNDEVSKQNTVWYSHHDVRI